MNEALYKKMLALLTDIQYHLEGGNPIRPHAYIFEEDEDAVVVIGRVLTEAGVKLPITR